jgi:predicted Rossmann fold flavoprotein
MRRIVIAGGGPAGFMAGIAAAEEAGEGARVEIWDAELALKTLLRTGGGRCNLANAASDGPRELAAFYPRGGMFLLSAFSRFAARQTMEWFASRGLALDVEDEGRVFPASRRSEDVRDFLKDRARAAGVRARERFPVLSAVKNGDCFLLGTRNGVQSADSLVIATGGDWQEGCRMPRIPSGYSLARGLGHRITPLAPALSGLVTTEDWPGRLTGLTLKRARLVARYKGRKAADERGDVVFTHTGISGPLVSRVSSRTAFLPFSEAEPLMLCLMPFPDDGSAEAEARLEHAISSHPRQAVLSALRSLLPRGLAETLTRIAGVEPATPCAQLHREDRRSLAHLLSGIPLTAVERRSEGEIVTAGGIELAGVDPATMGSRITEGLFFCGEILDVDGFTGGFNLQAAWSTGRLAGLSAARYVMGHPACDTGAGD